MKTIKILVLVSILAVTQSFALSKTEKNLLLGLGAGAIIIHTLTSHNNNRYEKPHHKIVYKGNNHSHRKYKKHHMRKHHNRGHHYHSHSSHHSKRYHRNNYRHNSLAVNKHHRY